MFVIAVFHGFLALAISAWTGRGSLATGLTVAVMVLSFFAVGWLPLIDGLESGVRAFPWHYYSSSQPHLNGVDWGDLSVLIAGIVLLGGAAVVGVNRRDLRGQASGEGLIGRLRSHPLTQNVVERLAGSTRVSRIWTKTASEHQGTLIVVSSVMFLVMGVMLGPMYHFIDDTLVDLGDALPEGMMELFGGGDLSTPEGWYQIETFGLMAPIAFMLVTVTIGARALAGEEAQRTMGLLLANPITRTTIVRQKALAMVIQTLLVAIALAAGVILGSALGGLGMSWPNIVATTTLAALLGMVFGALALAISAATGRVRVAVFGTIGLAIVCFVADGFLPLSDRFAGLAEWTPVYYYLTSDPLVNGINWLHAAVLAAMAAAFVWLAMILFDRRDLRQSG
jgi:ABC-2 type transport system permease protein